MLERTLKPVIKRVSKTFPVLLLTGQRQIGKSVLLGMLQEKKRRYVTLDNLRDRELAKTDPQRFIQENPPPVIIDEVQYAPELFTYIKIWVDEHKFRYLNGNQSANPYGAFWLTGSQKFSLMQGIQESLAGRVAILEMLGLSYKEITGRPFKNKPFLPSLDLAHKETPGQMLTSPQIFERVWRGSFPELIVTPGIDRQKFYASYIQTYIQRDVKDFYNINNEIAFYNFLTAVAARTGELLNYDNLAVTARIDKRTAKLWLEILVRSGVVYLLQPYWGNINKRIVKTPKVFFMDTGLAAYLTGWHTPASLRLGAQSGHLLETYVFGEIMKSYLHNTGLEPRIYFYRDSNKKEIDFILEQNMTLYPIGVKQTSLPETRDAANFKTLSKLKNIKVGTGAVICLCRGIAALPKQNVVCVPVGAL
ncbi:ATPase [Candidatus Termititenax persephonae]|uniref:ATPase n=1 Tax=Candidatus Termititenax persephonae TaxID=2218525 RepID=A0A388TK06_9BACT|nr:ATPase [Candidatus Termititenax persephonae]